LATSLSIKEAAEHYDVSEATIRRWIKAGKLRYVYVGGRRRIPKLAIDDFIQAGTLERKHLKDNAGTLAPVSPA
jgi:excisionase family DNA binding protein